MWIPPIPVDEQFREGVFCAECGEHLLGEACYDGISRHFCEPCMERLVELAENEAETYAEENCRITKPLPKYDPRFEYKCSPEAYEAGAKQSYTENSHMCHCRHNCTNYHELLKPLDKNIGNVWHRVRYWAIRERIDELLEDAMEEMADKDEFDDCDCEA